MYEKYLKRVLDLVFSGVGIIILTPLWIIIPVLIKKDDGGIVFYRAPRIGKGCKKFYMLKFRSMTENSKDIRNPDGSTYNADDDPRVTKIGRFLRKTSIDELPQLINVFKGEMSLIGPRASTWDALPSFKEDELDKMKVKPGISGYSQAYYRNSATLREKRLRDAWYANHVSFMLDIKIILKTIPTVLFQKNLYTNMDPKKKDLHDTDSKLSQ